MKPVEVVLLAEDEQLSYFARHFLQKYGYGPRDFTPIIAPPGCASQFVRERLPNELKAMRDSRKRSESRKKSKGKSTGRSRVLIVLTDCDNLSLKQRVATLSGECAANGVEWRKKGEPVLVITPKRNIETWFEYLRGKPVDEEAKKKFKEFDAESECRPQVDELHKMCDKGKLRDGAPASLVAACEEWKLLA